RRLKVAANNYYKSHNIAMKDCQWEAEDGSRNRYKIDNDEAFQVLFKDKSKEELKTYKLIFFPKKQSSKKKKTSPLQPNKKRVTNHATNKKVHNNTKKWQSCGTPNFRNTNKERGDKQKVGNTLPSKNKKGVQRSMLQGLKQNYVRFFLFCLVGFMGMSCIKRGYKNSKEQADNSRDETWPSN
ncbi:MAG: hypothetical protein ACPGC9_02320, partial [Cytophagales bacterium]